MITKGCFFSKLHGAYIWVYVHGTMDVGLYIVVRSPRLQGMRSAATNALQSGTSNYIYVFYIPFLSKNVYEGVVYEAF